MSPILDLFMTLLAMGETGYKHLRDERRLLASSSFLHQIQEVARKHGQKVMHTPKNTISFAVSLLVGRPQYAAAVATEFGAMLFIRGVSGVS